MQKQDENQAQSDFKEPQKVVSFQNQIREMIDKKKAERRERVITDVKRELTHNVVKYLTACEGEKMPHKKIAFKLQSSSQKMFATTTLLTPMREQKAIMNNEVKQLGLGVPLIEESTGMENYFQKTKQKVEADFNKAQMRSQSVQDQNKGNKNKSKVQENKKGVQTKPKYQNSLKRSEIVGEHFRRLDSIQCRFDNAVLGDPHISYRVYRDQFEHELEQNPSLALKTSLSQELFKTSKVNSLSDLKSQIKQKNFFRQGDVDKIEKEKQIKEEQEQAIKKAEQMSKMTIQQQQAFEQRLKLMNSAQSKAEQLRQKISQEIFEGTNRKQTTYEALLDKTKQAFIYQFAQTHQGNMKLEDLLDERKKHAQYVKSKTKEQFAQQKLKENALQLKKAASQQNFQSKLLFQSQSNKKNKHKNENCYDFDSSLYINNNNNKYNGQILNSTLLTESITNLEFAVDDIKNNKNQNNQNTKTIQNVLNSSNDSNTHNNPHNNHNIKNKELKPNQSQSIQLSPKIKNDKLKNIQEIQDMRNRRKRQKQLTIKLKVKGQENDMHVNSYQRLFKYLNRRLGANEERTNFCQIANLLPSHGATKTKYKLEDEFKKIQNMQQMNKADAKRQERRMNRQLRVKQARKIKKIIAQSQNGFYSNMVKNTYIETSNINSKPIQEQKQTCADLKGHIFDVCAKQLNQNQNRASSVQQIAKGMNGMERQFGKQMFRYYDILAGSDQKIDRRLQKLLQEKQSSTIYDSQQNNIKNLAIGIQAAKAHK